MNVSLSRRLQKHRLLLRALKSRVSRLFVENASVFDRQNSINQQSTSTIITTLA